MLNPVMRNPAAGMSEGQHLAMEPASDPSDRLLHAFQANWTGSLSPASLFLAWMDWSLHLANAPGHRLSLAQSAVNLGQRLFSPEHWLKPAPRDRRFDDPAWSRWPFNVFAQSFLLSEEWWRQATAALPGVTKAHSDVVAFAARQMLDTVSPSNFACTNPEILRATAAQGGLNFVRGARNFLEDARQVMQGKALKDVSGFEPGKDVAITPGKVVLRNDLMELIQYAPATGKVRPEPVLIVPAWIMRYYILDLTPQDSFIRYLVGQGFTVFCISWKNPGAEMRDVGLDDYRRLGPMAALDAISEICGNAPVHACGYCLGGTLLAIAAAAMARDGDKRLRTVSLLAAQTDFTEAGELQLFTDESELALLDDMMWRQGYLDSTQMAGAFEMLRSNELVWSRIIKTYLLGEREKATDLMSWNADATRMPYRMHSEYLHHMFLNNDLAEGRFTVEGRPVAISEISAPLFVLGTETDHVAPWRSVYKIHLLNQGDITFALASGGHNAGVVSEPGHPNRHYRLAHRAAKEPFVAPQDWERAVAEKEGSWWPDYAAWLSGHSGGETRPPATGSANYPPIADAPGRYVREP
jgi:polyhydroxyalkanoate synthase